MPHSSSTPHIIQQQSQLHTTLSTFTATSPELDESPMVRNQERNINHSPASVSLMDISMDASTQSSRPIMCDASTQTDGDCDNWARRKLTMDEVTASNKKAKFWTGIQNLTLLNFLFEYLEPCAKYVPLWMGKKHQNNIKTRQKPRPSLK